MPFPYTLCIPKTCVILIFWSFFTFSGFAIEFENCKPLRPSQNVEINCRQSNSTFGTKITTCTYKCMEYYVSFENPGQSGSNEVRCDPKVGNWTNLHRFRSFTCVEDCGKRVETPKPLIVHGNITNPSTWPWHATLFRKSSNSSWHYICGGSLIRNSVILTAAHCVTKQNGELINPDQFKIILGSISRNFSVNVNEQQHSERTQIFKVRKIYISSKHDARTLQADLALIHLSGEVQFNEHVLPICLPNEYALDLNGVKPGRFGDVVGYGVDETGSASETLKHAMLRVVSDSECFASLNRVPSESQFCAGENGPDGWTTVCNGDSGGGFVVPSPVHKKYFIHGIVSSGDKNKKDGVCQNYSIFTRVFQFIFWIRDNLEQISGEVIRELATGRNLPYVQKGIETIPAQFTGIPRDYDHLITAIELLYCDIDPDLFFKSLETNKGLQVLNLTHVQFAPSLTSAPDHRFVLQHLKTFILYIPKYLNGANPSNLTKSQLKSLLFFDKEYQSEDWPLEKITHLNVNIELTVSTSKLIIVDHERGRITWQGKYSSDVIQNLPLKFPLRHLSLRGQYSFNISRIHENRRLENLESLVLHHINLTGGRWSEFLRGMRRLEELRITMTQKSEWDWIRIAAGWKNISNENTIYLTSLPRSLRHLYLHNANLKVLQSESQILFHDNYNANTKMDPLYSHILPNLESFVCHNCGLDLDVIKYFPNIFHNVRKIIFFGNHLVNITNIIQNMEHLESIIVYYTKIKNIENFIGLDNIPLEYPSEKIIMDNSNNSNHQQYILKKKSASGHWVKSHFNTNQNLTHYIHSGFENFWTSYEEYYAESFLTSFEKSAYNSGEYKLNGTENKLETFHKIPKGVQHNLKSIHISNAEILTSDLLESLENATNLEYLILDNIRFIGVFFKVVELPHLKKYSLNTLHDPKASNIIGYNEVIVKRIIPIGRSYSISEDKKAEYCWNWSNKNSDADANKCRLTEQIRQFDYKPRPISKQEYGTMENFEIRHDDCITISMDYKAGIFIYWMEFSDDTVLTHLNETNMKNLSLYLTEREWNLITIPVKVEHLNLHSIDYNYPNISIVISDLLQPLDSLKRILIVHKGTERYRPPIKLMDLKNSAHNLELLSLVNVHVEYSSSVRFAKVETVFFDSCTFDKLVIENFFDDIFPSLKYVAIVSEVYDVNANEFSATEERLLLQALKNEKINRVFGWLFPIRQNGPVLQEILQILTGAHVRIGKSIGFVVERKNGTWVSVPFQGSVVAGDNKYPLELIMEHHRLRGDLEFGPIECSPVYDYTG